MGKTAHTYRERLDQWVNQYDSYRRALRGEYQTAFDDVLEMIHHHSMAGGSANFVDIERTAWMAVAIDQQAELNRLRERVVQLEGEASGFAAATPPESQQALEDVVDGAASR